MALESDVSDADAQLTVKFYEHQREPHVGKPFCRVMIPGNQHYIKDQPVTDDDKRRFPRQWLHYQMEGSNAAAIGTPLSQWHADDPLSLSEGQMLELGALQFQTAEQVAQASDAQLQRIGMGGAGLREKARRYVASRNRSDSDRELADTKEQLATLQAQMVELLSRQNEAADEPEKRGPGRPRKD